MTRWMLEQTAGLAHPIIGAAVSALDTFLVEKLFPHSGPAAFVNKTFPSLFRKRAITDADQTVKLEASHKT